MESIKKQRYFLQKTSFKFSGQAAPKCSGFMEISCHVGVIYALKKNPEVKPARLMKNRPESCSDLLKAVEPAAVSSHFAKRAFSSSV